MRPIRIDDADVCLTSIRFEALSRDGSQPITCWSGPPITVEDGAFMSWWKPTWIERLRIMCGAPVRVLVNYSLYGSLHLDTESRWGAPSSLDW
jgi:hypothetical protein